MKKLPESVENYIETILVLSFGEKPVRSIDIAKELNYSKPSVSIAMKKLRLDGYIEIDEKGYISLTKSGQDIAYSVYQRHKMISEWLMLLGVSKETAINDACKMEHGVSEESFYAIEKHIKEFMLEKENVNAN